ncbi:MAG: hypothetical protein KDA61_05000, partial [Planctomycetales bacterium]|nr:hypothetical protein [Planctomycetales bacterium]
MKRKPQVESLESRIALSAAGLVPSGAQPEGALSGKIGYAHGGHGYFIDPGWTYQRPFQYEMIEDLGNVDQMTLFVDEAWRAGATVVPLRPVGHQLAEVVLDNDDAEVTYSGTWTDSSSSISFGDAGDVPYRYATTSASETATAVYRPNLPSDGYYPVYAWTRAGSDRTEQLYRVNHAGGSTEVTVNHRQVGNGLVYLGTYYFDAGSEGSVVISNRSSEPGRVVIADMIRFGNGMGSINPGPGISLQSREDETGLYWVQWHVDHSQGISDSEYRAAGSSDRSSAVSFSPRYAEYMNREADGALSDRVFVSFHSNGVGGRGVLALYNGNGTPSSATPNQYLLAKTLGQEVNDDLVSQSSVFEHAWHDQGQSTTLDRTDIEFGEINNSYVHNEFDATIVEVAYHDDRFDAELMRDP